MVDQHTCIHDMLIHTCTHTHTHNMDTSIHACMHAHSLPYHSLPTPTAHTWTLAPNPPRAKKPAGASSHILRGIVTYIYRYTYIIYIYINRYIYIYRCLLPHIARNRGLRMVYYNRSLLHDGFTAAHIPRTR